MKVFYEINLGPRYNIDSVYLITDNRRVKGSFESYVRKEEINSLVGKPFDRDLLDDYRTTVAKQFRDNSFYGFSPSHITYVVDTNALKRTTTIGIRFSDRKLMTRTAKIQQ